MKKFISFVFSILICQAAGLIGLFFTTPAIPTWYASLVKPVFNPPNWLFGPAWVLLYTLLGIALYLIWQKVAENPKAKGVLWLFYIHLILNATWSPIFFGLKNPGLALINIIIFWLLIIILMLKFWPIRKVATYLLIPYFLWVTFATVLNYFIWYLN